jgi:hypothetical protein
MSNAMSQAKPSARSGSGNPMLKLVPIALVPVLGAIAFAVGVAMGARGDDMVILGLAVTTTVVGLVPLLIDRLRPPEKRQLVLSFISLAWIVAFVLPVYTEYYLTDGQFRGVPGLVGVQSHDLILGQLGSLLGLICLLIGFALPIGQLVGGAIPRPRRDWSPSQSLAVALVMIPMGLAISLAGQFGLVPERLGSGILSGMGQSYNIGIALLALTYFRYGARFAAMMALILIPPVMAMSFFTGSKTLLLKPLMMVAFAHILYTGRIRPIWIVGGILTIIVIYPIAAFYRDVVAAGNTLTAVEVLSNPGRAFALLSAFSNQVPVSDYLTAGLTATGTRFDAVGIASVILRDTPDRVPFQGGWSIGLVFLAYVPRILWADKPVITAIGQFVTDNYGPGPQIASNTAPSWVGEFYMNFGYPGIVIGLLSMGIIFRVVQTYLFGRKPTAPLLLAAIVIVSGVALSIEKALAPALNSILFNVVPIALAHIGVIALSHPPRRVSAPGGNALPTRTG